MEPEARYAWVGTVVLLLVALAAAAVVWLVASGQRRDVQSWRILFERQSLEGLQVRSDVRMKGIRVGAVTSFSFSTRRAGAVEVVVGINPSTPVRQSTRAVVDRNLVTGLATIRLLNLDETSPRLDAAAGENEAVIAEGESQLQQLSDTVSQLAETTDDTMRRVNALLSPGNLAAISATLEQLRGLTRTANGLALHLDDTVATFDQSARAVRTTVAGLGPDVHRLAERYDALGVQAGAGLGEVTASFRQLSSDASLLGSRSEALLASTDQELRQTALQLRGAADSLGSTARGYKDPRSLLFGPAPADLGPGEDRR